jgi:hypothetical protein
MGLMQINARRQRSRDNATQQISGGVWADAGRRDIFVLAVVRRIAGVRGDDTDAGYQPAADDGIRPGVKRVVFSAFKKTSHHA